MKLPLEFYCRNDVVQVSRDLLGKVLCSRMSGQVTKAVITETEAYAGVGDRASHAYGGRRTGRTEPMYRQGGNAYVYLCYGIHHLFNVVVGDVDRPLATLIRAGEALHGIDVMRQRRRKPQAGPSMLAGPGCIAQALGITTELSGVSLLEDCIWIEDRQITVTPKDIVAGPRVGIDYAGDDAALPYRFSISKQSLRLHHTAVTSGPARSAQ